MPAVSAAGLAGFALMQERGAEALRYGVNRNRRAKATRQHGTSMQPRKQFPPLGLF